MTLRILDPGLFTLVVDDGRPYCRSLGVSVGGAADRFALALGNGLVGNQPECPALEVSLVGPSVVAAVPLRCVVYGAEFELFSDAQCLTAGKTFFLQPNEQLCIGRACCGMRAYFCVQGGFNGPLILGSHTGLAPLKTGAEVLCTAGLPARPRFLRPQVRWNREPRTIRVLAAPQADWFDDRELYGQAYRVAPASNRMGLRLRGRPLVIPDRELVSEPVCPGTVQVTRDGQCIILGVDGQTIGGYPKIAQVISADVDKLAQLRPNEEIHFLEVDLKEAEWRYRQKQAELGEWVTRLLETA
jgi:antagonist of KipI